MVFNKELSDSGMEDYIVLEQTYAEQGILNAITNNGGMIPVGNFGFAFSKKDKGVILLEIRYFPKGNYAKLKYKGKKKVKRDFSSEATEEVEL